jgi:hypothetical protein
MSDSRTSGESDRLKTEPEKSSQGLLIGGFIAALVIGLGAWGWVELPRMFPFGIPGLSLMASHVSCLNEFGESTRARIELQGGIKDVASAKAAIPALRRAYARQTAADDAWAKLLTENPPSGSQATELQEMLWKEFKKNADAEKAVAAANIGMAPAVANAIRVELNVLGPEAQKMSASRVNFLKSTAVLLLEMLKAKRNP